MNLKKAIIILIIEIIISALVLFSGCTSQKKVAAPPVNPEPHWVKDYPIEPAYYAGVASAPIDPFSTQHVSAARDAALSEIASSITVQIVSESESVIREDDLFYSQTFEERISSFAKQELEGYELVDTWEGNGQYWVFYRLSKQLYQQQMEEKINNAREASSELLKTAINTRESGNLRQSLIYLLQAYDKLGDFPGYGIKTQVGEKEVLIDNYIYRNLQEILNNLQINTPETVVNGKFLQPLDRSIEIMVKDDGNQPVADFPMKFYFSTGNGELTKTGFTHSDGSVLLTVSRVQSPMARQTIIAEPDLGWFRSQVGESVQVSELVNNLSVTSRAIEIKLNPVVVCIESGSNPNSNRRASVRGSSSYSGNEMENLLRSKLSDKGFRFTEKDGECGYTMNIKTSARNGTVLQDIHTAFCDATVTFLDEKNEELISFNIRNISGADLSFQKAKKKATENALNQLSEKIMDRFFGE